MNQNGDKLRNACQAASLAFKKINNPKHADLISKLEFCIGSYDYDKNPVGLYEYGEKALKLLKDFKVKNPRKVSQKVITDLEKNMVR